MGDGSSYPLFQAFYSFFFSLRSSSRSVFVTHCVPYSLLSWCQALQSLHLHYEYGFPQGLEPLGLEVKRLWYVFSPTSVQDIGMGPRQLFRDPDESPEQSQ